MPSPPPCFSAMRSISIPERRARRALLLAAWVAASPLAGACASAEPSEHGAPVRVVIPVGSSFGRAADSLVAAEIIDHPRLFRLYAILRGRDRSLKPGTYVLRPGQSYGAILRDLTEGRGLVHTVTVPEGLALTAILPLLERQLELSRDSLNVAARDSALRAELGVPTRTLEGYLFPDTYSFPAGTPAREVVQAMVRRFDQAWRDEWDARLAEIGMTRHELVTLASIVEKEARLAEERPVIAAVYRNRLRIGMALQADPTVQYALGGHKARILYKDLEVESPYNTYRYPGLPPGPIASPGAASLEAALFPADVRYLYFVAHPDGHHEFRETFGQHEQAVIAMRRERARQEAAARRGGASRSSDGGG